MAVRETADAITSLSWGDGAPLSANAILREARHQIDAYLAGSRHHFDLPLDPAGTPFQQAVWREMVAIPYGGTRTYGDLARDLRSSPRAVGRACGENPIPSLIPCHRILAAGGASGGFSGGKGVATKHHLLALEGVALAV